MVKTGNLNRLALFIGMMVIALVGFTFLASVASGQRMAIQVRAGQQAAVAIEWTEVGKHVAIPPNLVVADHAGKHVGQHLDAWYIYAMLLEGQCVATAVFCGGSEIDRLFLCTDPTGRIGGLIVLGDEILTGYEGKLGYWENVVSRDRWEVCGD